jgi:hypothetical protein
VICDAGVASTHASEDTRLAAANRLRMTRMAVPSLPRNSGLAHLTYGFWLGWLSAAFVVRVVAQPLALVVDTPYLPRFDAWHSGALPYPALVASQVAILVWLAGTAARVRRGTLTRRRRFGTWLLTLGAVYATSMVARLVLGVTMFRDVRWFASPVPTLFHLVLAAYLLVYGHFHYRHGH